MIDGWMDEWVDESMDRRTDGRKDEEMYGWMERRSNGGPRRVPYQGQDAIGL